MKKRFLPFFLAILLALAPVFAFPIPAQALSVNKGYGTDEYVYAPAVFDLVVATDAEEPSYQWFVSVGYNRNTDELMRIDDEGNWSGTKTAHLKLITHDGLEYTEDGSGWDGLYFRCRVTGKDGKVSWGPNMNMTIYTHASLLKVLQKEGVEFTSHDVRYADGTALSFLREEDGVRYYESTQDKALDPVSTYHPISSDLRAHCDGELVREYYITYDGKTVPYTNTANGFRPEKYGTTVVFRTDLVLYVNGTRMETLDSVTSAVNVKAPSGVGTATTKTSCSLLAEQYSQARVLKNLSKGQIVRLLSDSGGYWRVCVDGYFGYIPKTALAVSDAINTVAVTVPEPTDGKTPASITVLPADPDLYRIDPKWNQEMWYDNTSGRFLGANDLFQAGHTYTLTVWVTAQNGKRFPLSGGKPDVAGWVNGSVATVNKAYEQDPEEIIELTSTFTHVHTLTKVNRVYPTCTEDGKELHYYCSGCGWGFEDPAAQTPILSESWGIIPARGHLESEWMSNGTSHYKVCLRRECGETIPGTLGKHTGGTATCMSKKICEVCGLPYGELGSHTYSAEWTYKTKEGHAHGCTELRCTAHSALVPHRPGPAATDTEAQVCLDCGYVITPAKSHVHQPSKVEAVDATCTQEGHIAYYVCDGCGEWFYDAAGKRPIADHDEVITPALKHKAQEDWSHDETAHWHTCTLCGKPIEETREKHTDTDKDGKCDVCKASFSASQSSSSAGSEPSSSAGSESPSSTGSETSSSGGSQTSSPPGSQASSPEHSQAEASSQGRPGIPLLILILIAVFAAAVLAGAVVVIIIVSKRKKK